MKAFEELSSVEEILDFCIDQEEGSFKLYSALADLMEQPEVSRLFHELALLEARHKQEFLDVKESKTQLCVRATPPEIEIREDLPPIGEAHRMRCHQAIGLAIKKEVISALLYEKLAEIVEDENLRNLLWAVADEERRHKRHFDMEFERCQATESYSGTDNQRQGSGFHQANDRNRAE